MTIAQGEGGREALRALLRERLPATQIWCETESLQRYGRDWTRFYAPDPLAVIFPTTTEEVQEIVRFARDQKLPVVPSGGRTGLSGAACATAGELVVSFDKMNQIAPVNRADQTLRCGPGAITAAIQEAAAAAGLIYPVDFAAAGSSQIGGNISTNAGGINVIRYGMTRSWIAGLKVVTGTGELLDLNRGLLKNNSGYDLRQLFIGAEGTLGFIVEATLQLCPPPAQSRVLLLGVPTLDALTELLISFREKLTLQAFEFFSALALEKVLARSDLPQPLSEPTPFYALIEVEAPGSSDEEVALTLFETALEEGWAVDGVMSQSREQAAQLWRYREEISETISHWTPYKNDVSVCISEVPGFLSAVEEVVLHAYPELEIVWFGHIGDGNLHLNILKPEALSVEEFKARCDTVSPQIFAEVQRRGGSISAEHGIGLLKKDYLTYTRSAEELVLMRGIKALFDPDKVMNPGKIFD